jgi:hypothetical protein
MLSAWGLLAFLKATDTRENASFAARFLQVRSGKPWVPEDLEQQARTADAAPEQGRPEAREETPEAREEKKEGPPDEEH